MRGENMTNVHLIYIENKSNYWCLLYCN